MTYTSQTITVTVTYKPPPFVFPEGKRWQGWQWVASAGNHEPLARSTEMYANQDDAVDCASILFDPRATVRIVDDTGERILRVGRVRWKTCSECGRGGSQQFQMTSSGRWVCRFTIACQARKATR